MMRFGGGGGVLFQGTTESAVNECELRTTRLDPERLNSRGEMLD